MAQADSALTKAEISRILSYPFDSQYILKKRRALKKALLADVHQAHSRQAAAAAHVDDGAVYAIDLSGIKQFRHLLKT